MRLRGRKGENEGVVWYRWCAGVVISASHNPFYDKGIKIFCGRGEDIQDGRFHG
ncbi:MAG: hypothetical protein JRI46_09740 [Deltaproteobacteria bacterium]|nr:hypothetical protein [Deltaproteobacteria bacterium]